MGAYSERVQVQVNVPGSRRWGMAQSSLHTACVCVWWCKHTHHLVSKGSASYDEEPQKKLTTLWSPESGKKGEERVPLKNKKFPSKRACDMYSKTTSMRIDAFPVECVAKKKKRRDAVFGAVRGTNMCIRGWKGYMYHISFQCISILKKMNDNYRCFYFMCCRAGFLLNIVILPHVLRAGGIVVSSC